MKVKNVKLEWNVLYWDINKHRVQTYNILNDKFKYDLYKQIKNKKITNYIELKDYIKRDCMYHYWSKSEYEMSIGPLWCTTLDDLKQFEKVDVYKQIEINLDHIVQYIVNIMKIKF